MPMTVKADLIKITFFFYNLISSSINLKYCWNLQADHHSHISPTLSLVSDNFNSFILLYMPLTILIVSRSFTWS